MGEQLDGSGGQKLVFEGSRLITPGRFLALGNIAKWCQVEVGLR